MQGRLETRQKINHRIDKRLDGEPSYLNAWVRHLQAEKTSVKTINDYLGKVLAFLTFINEDINSIDLTKITSTDIDNYFIKIQTKNTHGKMVETSVSFCKATRSALSNFFKYQLLQGNVEQEYVSSIKIHGHDVSHTKTDLLTAADFKKMLEYDNLPGENHHFKVRNKAILLLLMTTGMRRSALCEINIEDIDLDIGLLTIKDKGDKPFEFTLTPDTLIEIRRWMKIRERYLNNKNTDALFISRLGTRINGNVVRDIVNENTYKALGKAINPHKIRGGFCSILYEQTHDIEFVSKTIGHNQLQTTKSYVNTENNERQIASRLMSKLLA